MHKRNIYDENKPNIILRLTLTSIFILYLSLAIYGFKIGLE